MKTGLFVSADYDCYAPIAETEDQLPKGVPIGEMVIVDDAPKLMIKMYKHWVRVGSLKKLGRCNIYVMLKEKCSTCGRS